MVRLGQVIGSIGILLMLIGISIGGFSSDPDTEEATQAIQLVISGFFYLHLVWLYMYQEEARAGNHEWELAHSFYK